MFQIIWAILCFKCFLCWVSSSMGAAFWGFEEYMRRTRLCPRNYRRTDWKCYLNFRYLNSKGLCLNQKLIGKLVLQRFDTYFLLWTGESLFQHSKFLNFLHMEFIFAKFYLAQEFNWTESIYKLPNEFFPINIGYNPMFQIFSTLNQISF